MDPGGKAAEGEFCGGTLLPVAGGTLPPVAGGTVRPPVGTLEVEDYIKINKKSSFKYLRE